VPNNDKWRKGKLSHIQLNFRENLVKIEAKILRISAQKLTHLHVNGIECI